LTTGRSPAPSPAWLPSFWNAATAPPTSSWSASSAAASNWPSGRPIPTGKLDITLYRDDLQAIGPRPVIGETQLPVALDGRTVVIVDDVLYTGRTVRAALDELADFGRPRRILLCVLVDRGGRELPIQPDIIGLRQETGPQERVEVLVRELDGRDAVELVRSDS
jgi:pyrimidine operon attenuation protein / uracil phosphoribosyltransferase